MISNYERLRNLGYGRVHSLTQVVVRNLIPFPYSIVEFKIDEDLSRLENLVNRTGMEKQINYLTNYLDKQASVQDGRWSTKQKERYNVVLKKLERKN